MLKILCTHFLPSCSRSDREAQDVSIFCVPGCQVTIAVNKNVDHRSPLTLPGIDTLTNHHSLSSALSGGDNLDVTSASDQGRAVADVLGHPPRLERDRRNLHLQAYVDHLAPASAEAPLQAS